MAVEILQALGVVVPLLAIAAFALPLISLKVKKKVFYDIYTLVFTIIALIASLEIFRYVYNTGKPALYPFGGWPPVVGIVYEVDAFSAILGVLTTSVMLLIVIYSIWYTKFMDEFTWYYTLLLGMEAGLLGCLYTGDAFNLFVMIEVLAISAYGLVAYYRSKPQAIEAAIKYAIIGAVATTLYFLSLVFIYAAYGSLNMADIAFKAMFRYSMISGSIYGNIISASATALALALWTFTFKAALFPNHFWLPDAHPEAPTPVSAALSGLVVNIGVYATARFMYTMFGAKSVLAETGFREAVFIALLILGILSGLVGALLMMVQNDIKRLLAYSTISHIGLLFMAAAIGLAGTLESVRLGLVALVYHTINHSVGKALLFLAAGVLIHAAGTRDLDKMGGVGRFYPLASLSLILGFFQLMGFPGFGGFFSKLLLYQAYLSAGMLVPAIMVVVISAISILGYIKAIYAIVFMPPKPGLKKIKGLDTVSIITLFMGFACIVLGITAPYFIPVLTNVVNQSLMPQGVINYINTFLQYLRSLLPRT
ncbi:cation:proton antiporter [Desulfurococcaceae archaeon MEX13E-LK6-19]|nr:cation:proton antiporter [Desulfurococcaceae archaeon MEX13E-LK6-19]